MNQSKKWLAVAAASLMAVVMLAGCSSEVAGTSEDSTTGTSESGLSGSLKFAGSSSMAAVVSALGETFTDNNPNVTVTVDQQGSGSAVTALNDGTAQIGNLSRLVKDEENAEGKLEVINIAIDGIAVIVNPANTVADLTKDQIAAIFKGEITNWKDVGGANKAIYVVGREEGSGTRDGFESLIKAEGKCKYGVLLKETGDVVSKVSSEAAAIGYISFASLGDSVKGLKVGGVAPTEATISDKSYALQRPFVQAYRKGTGDELVLAYLEFLKSEQAQNIIKSEKLIPVKFWEV